MLHNLIYRVPVAFVPAVTDIGHTENPVPQPRFECRSVLIWGHLGRHYSTRAPARDQQKSQYHEELSSDSAVLCDRSMHHWVHPGIHPRPRPAVYATLSAGAARQRRHHQHHPRANFRLVGQQVRLGHRRSHVILGQHCLIRQNINQSPSLFVLTCLCVCAF